MRKRLLSTLVCFICLLAGCGKLEDSRLDKNISSKDNLIHGASSMGSGYCVSEYGLFLLEDNNMKYYDFEADETYTICDRPNCRHQDDSCPAYFEQEGDVAGLAEVGGKLYAFCRDREKNCYDFTEMGLTGDDRRTIATLDIGDYRQGNWIITSVDEDVYYLGNMVWFKVNYQFVDVLDENITAAQCMGINLNSGEIVTLNERNHGEVQFEIEAISDKNLVLRKTWMREEPLSEEEFQRSLESGEFQGYEFEENSDPYSAYYTQWYPEHVERLYEYLIYRIETGESHVMESGIMNRSLDSDGHVAGYLPRYSFLGWYEGELLGDEPDYSGKSQVFLWNVENDNKNTLFTIENGGTLAFFAGSVTSNIIDQDKLLYCEYNDREMADIFSFNLKSGECRHLFEDDRNISFRITGQTSEKLVGNVYDLNAFSGYTTYWIAKEDYFSGKIDRRVKIRTGI